MTRPSTLPTRACVRFPFDRVDRKDASEKTPSSSYSGDVDVSSHKGSPVDFPVSSSHHHRFAGDTGGNSNNLSNNSDDPVKKKKKKKRGIYTLQTVVHSLGRIEEVLVLQTVYSLSRREKGT